MTASRKLVHILMASVAIIAWAAAPSFASQDAVLRNGFSIRHERRKVIGAVTRLYVNADGSSYVDIPTEEIEHFDDAPAEIKTASPAADSRALPHQKVTPVDLNQVISAASGRYRLDPDLVNSVIRAESGFNVRARGECRGGDEVSPGTSGALQL
jgi:soluble lytic murein transglycosylase-like protein